MKLTINVFIGLYFPFFMVCINDAVSIKTNSECAELGFAQSNVTCTLCELLDQFDLKALKEDCLDCCTLTDQRNIKRYPKARLEMCTCKFAMFPQIRAFIQSERAHKFPNLEIKHYHGANPVIKLLDKHGTVKEVLSIDKWNTDAIEEFFNLYLEPAKKSKYYYLDTNEV